MPELTTRFIDDCVAKLELLDEFAGQRISRQALEPFPIDQTGAATVQHAAQRIGEFIGLGRYTFVISFCSQQEQVAGHIELRQDVVINAGGMQLRTNFWDVCSIKLAETLRPSPSAVCGTLAHEITHKYLQVNRVPSGSGATRGFEDEILTDVASVWLGLGKLVLNGCETHSAETNWSGTRTTTTRHTVGYLTPSQFAFVYLLVSTGRDLSEEEYEHGLGADALVTLRDVRQQHSSCINHDGLGNRLRSAGRTPPQEPYGDVAEQSAELHRSHALDVGERLPPVTRLVVSRRKLGELVLRWLMVLTGIGILGLTVWRIMTSPFGLSR